MTLSNDVVVGDVVHYYNDRGDGPFPATVLGADNVAVGGRCSGRLTLSVLCVDGPFSVTGVEMIPGEACTDEFRNGWRTRPWRDA